MLVIGRSRTQYGTTTASVWHFYIFDHQKLVNLAHLVNRDIVSSLAGHFDVSDKYARS